MTNLWRWFRNLDEIDRLNQDVAELTNFRWMVCGVVDIPADSSGGKFRDAIKNIKNPECGHSHTFQNDLPEETCWCSYGMKQGPHGSLKIVGCYKCGKVWCKDWEA